MGKDTPAWQRVRKNFTTGLLVFIPLVATVVVIRWGIGLIDGAMDNVISVALPKESHPIFRFPGRGLILFLILTYVTGLFARNFLGSKLIGLGEKIVNRIPLVRSIYSTFKQILESLFDTAGGESFKSVVLVEFPQKGMWSVGFVTTESMDDVEELTQGDDMICVFVPTTPNFTTGFFIQLERDVVIPIKMKVEDGLKWLMSSGLVHGNGSIMPEDMAKMKKSLTQEIPILKKEDAEGKEKK